MAFPSYLLCFFGITWWTKSFWWDGLTKLYQLVVLRCFRLSWVCVWITILVSQFPARAQRFLLWHVCRLLWSGRSLVAFSAALAFQWSHALSPPLAPSPSLALLAHLTQSGVTPRLHPAPLALRLRAFTARRSALKGWVVQIIIWNSWSSSQNNTRSSYSDFFCSQFDIA